MKKNTIKINESQLKGVIAKAIKNVIKEDDNEGYAKQFLNWALDGEGSRTGIMQNIWGYYDAKVHHNESDAQWYFDEVLRIYADGIGCEESELNVPAIEKAINYWGAYNYAENTDETEIQENKKSVKLNENQLHQIVAESVKKVLKESQPSPYQDIIDRLTPIYRELYGKFGGIGNGVELSQEEANQLDAANHILKAMDLLRYPNMRRDN